MKSEPCPFCGSEHIRSATIREQHGTTFISEFCWDCHSLWDAPVRLGKTIAAKTYVASAGV